MQIIENQTLTSHQVREDIHYRKCTFIIDEHDTALLNILFENCTFVNESNHKLDIRDCTFKSCDLSLLVIEDSYLLNVEFTHCKLMNFSFYKCYLKNVTLADCMCHFMSLSDSKAFDLTVKNCSCTQATFMRLDHKNLVFDTCTLDGLNFEETNLNRVDLRSCEFSHILYTPYLLSGLKVRTDQAISFAVQMGVVVDN